MSKRAPQPSYLQPIECMQAPSVRHAAQMVEQALYEADWPMRSPAEAAVVLGPRTNGVGLIVGSLFPKRVEHPHCRKVYAAELAAHPRLLKMLTTGKGVDGVYEAAGLTAAQREAIELRGAGLGVVEIARTLGIRHRAVQERLAYGLRKLTEALAEQGTYGGAMHVA